MTDTVGNLAIWKAVEKTDPANTKKVSMRGGFTSICANSQIKAATEQFGPIGQGWGYIVESFERMDALILVSVTLWHTSRDNTFGPILGCAEMFGKRPDHDAPKKATTDAITKGLSQLGFNADVFMGLYDDNKYIEEVTAEFADKGKVSMTPEYYWALPADKKDAAWASIDKESQTLISGSM